MPPVKNVSKLTAISPGATIGSGACCRLGSLMFGFKLWGPVDRNGRKFDIDTTCVGCDVTTCSNALNALPSEGSPRGKLRDFANADDESTKSDVVTGCCATRFAGCDVAAGEETFAAAVCGMGLCIGDAGTGLKIWKKTRLLQVKSKKKKPVLQDHLL